MADYALVVGIEKYDTPAAHPLQGPALDAMRFALWLRKSKGMPAKNIILIHNKSDAWKDDFEKEYQKVLDAVKGEGIEPRENPSRANIYNAWCNELPAPRDGGTVWIYWSGHGVTFPSNRDAVLCAGSEAGNPSFVYLAEIRDSLRNKLFAGFENQRLIVDACAEYINPDDLGIRGFRRPDDWAITQSPEQIELSAVAMGGKASAEQGGNPFTRELLNELEHGWPADLPAFFKSLNDRIAKAVPGKDQRPRLRILSPHFEDGLATGGKAAECGLILQVLGDCGISFDQYRQPYFETMSRLPNSARALAASSLTAMIGELLALNPSELYSGLPEALVEFFVRVVRTFGKERTEPLQKWMDDKKISPAARSTIDFRLSQESSDLLLTILLQETASSPNGFPCNVRAHLTDAYLVGTIDSWSRNEVADPPTLEEWAREVLDKAGKWAVRKTTGLSVQVFANLPLLGVPWQYFTVDPEAPEQEKFFGELYPFVLRSRARYELPQKFEYQNWQAKSDALRFRLGRAIDFTPAPPLDSNAKYALAQIDGLLFFRDTVTIKFERDAAIYRLWGHALNKGLPLAAWRTCPPERTEPLTYAEWEELQKNLRELFDECPSIGNTPQRFREARSKGAWALGVVLFWDDAKSADQLRNMFGNEVKQL